jgi:hypothetical protein
VTAAAPELGAVQHPERVREPAAGRRDVRGQPDGLRTRAAHALTHRRRETGEQIDDHRACGDAQEERGGQVAVILLGEGIGGENQHDEWRQRRHTRPPRRREVRNQQRRNKEQPGRGSCHGVRERRDQRGDTHRDRDRDERRDEPAGEDLVQRDMRHAEPAQLRGLVHQRDGHRVAGNAQKCRRDRVRHVLCHHGSQEERDDSGRWDAEQDDQQRRRDDRARLVGPTDHPDGTEEDGRDQPGADGPGDVRQKTAHRRPSRAPLRAAARLRDRPTAAVRGRPDASPR